MTKIIAHRGFGKEKKQNTVAAFRYASESRACGIETDVRITKDGMFIVFHDKNAARLTGRDKVIEKTEFKALQKLKIYDQLHRHKIATFTEFLQNCKLTGKTAVVEIKSDLTREQTEKLTQIIVAENYLSKTIFISFKVQILKWIRALLPEQPIQLLMLRYKREYLSVLRENNFGMDISHRQLTEERIRECHENGIEVNCWTVNRRRRAKILQQWGVDFITTDKLALSEKI